MWRPSGWRWPMLVRIAGALMGAALAMMTWGRVQWFTEAFLVELSAKPTLVGQTRLALPPLGAVVARTHWSPIELKLELQSIDVTALRAFLADQETLDEVGVWAYQESQQALLALLRRLLLLALLGGALGSGLASQVLNLRRLPKPTWLQAIASGAMVGLLFAGTLAALTVATFDRRAFDTPQYHGALDAAQWMINLAQDAVVSFDALGERLSNLVAGFGSMFERIRTLDARSDTDADYLVMHVSDIHNNIAALRFIDQAAATFRVDLIINTGDYTDFATELEAALARPLGEPGTPNLFVSGNHESQNIIDRITATGIRVLDAQTTVVGNLNIAGFGDPNAGVREASSPDMDAIEALVDQITQQVQQASPPIDIVVVHNHRVATSLAPGLVPVVLYGHNHVARVSQQGGTTYVNAGTTGAAGLRGIEMSKVIPFSLALLHYNIQAERPRLLAVDILEVAAIETGFRMQRYLIRPDEPSETVEEITPAAPLLLQFLAH